MKDIEGELVELVNEGTIIGARVKMADGKVRTFWGDHRMMLDAFEGRKNGVRVIIHYEAQTDWTVEFPDDEG